MYAVVDASSDDCQTSRAAPPGRSPPAAVRHRRPCRWLAASALHLISFHAVTPDSLRSTNKSQLFSSVVCHGSAVPSATQQLPDGTGALALLAGQWQQI